MSKPKKAKATDSLSEKIDADVFSAITQKTKRQIWFWLAALAVTVLFLYIFRSILLPFVAGMALAYMLDPVADRLENWAPAAFSQPVSS